MAATVRLLMIGKPTITTGVTLTRLSDCGWGWYGVEKVVDGRELLNTFEVDVVLATEALPDGRGYDVADSVAKQKASLLVAVALSENSLWLPVIDRGARVLGSRAIGANLLEAELVRVLTARALERGTASFSPPERPPKNTAPLRNRNPRRKSVAAA